MEIWKDMVSDSNYEVSSYGNIRHKKNMKNRAFRLDSKGYYRFNTSNGTFHPHKEVAKAFIDNSENKPFINHIDAIRTNNNVDNLEWCTQKENMQHAYNIGTRGKGEKHGRAILSEEQVKEIKYKLLETMMQKDIAKMFNVSEGAIQGIARGNNWSHI